MEVKEEATLAAAAVVDLAARARAKVRVRARPKVRVVDSEAADTRAGVADFKVDSMAVESTRAVVAVDEVQAVEGGDPPPPARTHRRKQCKTKV